MPVARGTWAAGERRTDPNGVVDDRVAPAGRRCATAAVGGRRSSFRRGGPLVGAAVGRWSGCVDDGCRRSAATRGVHRGHRDGGAEPWIALEDHGVAQRRIHLPDRPCGRLGVGGGQDSGPGGGTRGFRDGVADQLTEQRVADQRPAPRRSADRHGSARVGGGGRRCVHLSRGTGPRGRGGTEFGWCGVRPPDGLGRLGGESPRTPAGARRARVARVGPGAVGAVRGRGWIRR